MIPNIYLSDEQIKDLILHHRTYKHDLDYNSIKVGVKAAADNAVRVVVEQLPRRKSMLEDCAYQGIPPKKWVKETAPYYDGYNKCLEEIESILKKLALDK